LQHPIPILIVRKKITKRPERQKPNASRKSKVKTERVISKIFLCSKKIKIFLVRNFTKDNRIRVDQKTNNIRNY